MIGYLSGKIIEKDDSTAVILVGGVGYSVQLPVPVLGKTKIDDVISLFTYTYVREDVLALYGFPQKEELDFFKLLLSVSGIGPKVALAVISSYPVEKIKNSIAKGDPNLLSGVSGVGKKTAEKAVVELKGKIGYKDTGSGASSGSENEDVYDALISLGFQRQEIAESLARLPDSVSGSEAKIKEILKTIGKSK